MLLGSYTVKQVKMLLGSYTVQEVKMLLGSYTVKEVKMLLGSYTVKKGKIMKNKKNLAYFVWKRITWEVDTSEQRDKPQCINHRVHRVATAAFWRTFHHDGKISPGWWGWGMHAHPLLIYYHHVQSCSVRSSWEGGYTPSISSLPYMYILCNVSRFWIPVHSSGSAGICSGKILQVIKSGCHMHHG